MATPEKIQTARGDGWRVQSHYRDETGKLHWLSRRIYPAGGHSRAGANEARLVLADLEAEAAQLRRQANARRDVGPSQARAMTVRDLAERWLEWKSARWTERGGETTAGRVRRQILRDNLPPVGRDTEHDDELTALASMPVRHVGPPDIAAHLQLLAVSGHLRKHGGLSRSSLQKVHAHLSGIFGHGLYLGVVDVNPCAVPDLIPGRPDDAELVIPTRSQAAKAWGWEGDPTDDLERGFRLRSQLRVAIATGARRGEIIGLRWTDVDFDAQTLHIRRSVTAAGGALHVKSPKNSRTRHFIADPAIFDELALWRETVRKLFASEALPEYVWFSHSHRRGTGYGVGPQHPDTLSSGWTRLRDDLGCDGVRFHDWRHFCATELLAGGIDPATVAARLGHSTEVLLRTYAHAVPASDHRAASVVSAAIQAG